MAALHLEMWVWVFPARMPNRGLPTPGSTLPWRPAGSAHLAHPLACPVARPRPRPRPPLATPHLRYARPLPPLATPRLRYARPLPPLATPHLRYARPLPPLATPRPRSRGPRGAGFEAALRTRRPRAAEPRSASAPQPMVALSANSFGLGWVSPGPRHLFDNLLTNQRAALARSPAD
jgi:hypothetical protein